MPIPWAIYAHEQSTSNRQSQHQGKRKAKVQLKIDTDPIVPRCRNETSQVTGFPVDIMTSNPLDTTFEHCTDRTQYDSTTHNYIKWNPQDIELDDFNYLLMKGAFTIPHTNLRYALLKSYIDHVHPHLPMLNLNDFLWRIQENDGVHFISPLLFQTVMFTSTSFVDLKYLHRAGYRDRNSARKAFFQKARLLYDFDMEVNRIAIVQSLVLMSYWHDFPEDEKNCRHWLEVGMSLAQRIGLHRNPAESSMGSGCLQLRKRLWWSIYACGAWVCLRTEESTLLTQADFDVPGLSFGDFDLHPFQPEIVSVLGLEEFHYSNYHRDLAGNLIQRLNSWCSVDIRR